MASNIPQTGAPPPPPHWGNAPPPPPRWDQAQSQAPLAYGGFWIRLVAYVIDAIIVNIASAIIGSVLGFGIGSSGAGGETEAAIAGGVVGLVLGLGYFAGFESSPLQATLGKLAVGLRVTKGDGTRLSFGRALGRAFAKMISGLILFIGFIMIAFSDRKRGLHDMMADTLVVKAR